MRKKFIIGLLGIGVLVVVSYFTYQRFTNIQQSGEHTIIVDIKTGISESKILAFENVIKNLNSVQSIQYKSAAQVLADFRSKHQDDKLTLQSLDELGSNPLGAILTITITDSSQKQFLENLIQTNDRDSVIDRINPYNPGGN